MYDCGALFGLLYGNAFGDADLTGSSFLRMTGLDLLPARRDLLFSIDLGWALRGFNGRGIFDAQYAGQRPAVRGEVLLVWFGMLVQTANKHGTRLVLVCSAGIMLFLDCLFMPSANYAVGMPPW